MDDFALRRGQSYASVLIDAASHERIDVVPDRKSDSTRAWLNTHPGVEVIVRDGSTAYAEGSRRALHDAVQQSRMYSGAGGGESHRRPHLLLGCTRTQATAAHA
ncbi:transposase [Nocardia brasiliensis]|uniref:transposase n=1 Tax=Nocardia brasiliensis TaxID=37326 RepID=UPI002456E708|nr:transposase [Nocardia brasiliensis]